MEETQLPENSDSTESKGCINCGSDNIVEGHSTQLCSDCRQLFIKYPIPLPIKLFAIGVALIMAFALFSFPKNLSNGIHLERGIQFEKKKQYLSAQREFTSVIQQLPENIEANVHLLEAAFYNLDFETLVKTAQKLEGKKTQDKKLKFRVEDIIARAQDYFPNTAMNNLLAKYGDNESGVPDSAYVNFLKANPYNQYGLFAFASKLYAREEWTGCDSLLQQMLQTDSDHMIALRMQATVKRQQGLWNESIKSCEKIIKLNNEAGYAYATMARTYLKWNKMAKGLELAEKSVAINKKDPFNTATLALAWHFNKQASKRDEVIKELKSHADSTALGYVQFVLDVINNKESL